MTNRPETIVEMTFGSHLYGTNTPASDLDYKAVHIPTAQQILLGNPQNYDVITKNTKSGSLEKNTKEDVDHESYSLKKFLKLASEGQTVAMDILFCPRSMCLTSDPIWDEIQANKDKLITSKAASFVGYCRTQANKYGIKGSRMEAAETARNFFAEMILHYGTSAKLEQFPDAIQKMADSSEHIEVLSIPSGHQNERFVLCISVCNKKTQFPANLKTAYDCYSRLYDEYGKRAMAAKNNEGIDWKALSHAVRVGRECIELLTTGTITFPRPEAARLIQIKTGLLKYNEVAEEIEHLLVDAEDASLKSSLPTEPDYDWINELVYQVYRERVINE